MEVCLFYEQSPSPLARNHDIQVSIALSGRAKQICKLSERVATASAEGTYIKAIASYRLETLTRSRPHSFLYETAYGLRVYLTPNAQPGRKGRLG